MLNLMLTHICSLEICSRAWKRKQITDIIDKIVIEFDRASPGGQEVRKVDE